MIMKDMQQVDEATRYFADHFDDDRPAGKVVGSTNFQGVRRRGADVDNVIGIDHGALRIQPPLQTGWGLTGLTYGPYQRVNGLAFGLHLLNGHNTSQTGDLVVSLPRRVLRWMRGSGADPAHLRLARWLFKGDKQMQARQLRRWVWIDRHYKNGHEPTIDENLALGWFPTERPADPLSEGNAFVVHATGADNGQLWVRVASHLPAVVSSLQNIPVYYLVILRESGAAYYAGSLPGARGLAAYPEMRPLAIDPYEESESVYAALYQSVLGQIGFRVDTRLYTAQVEQIPALGEWYGTAHAADRLQGDGLLDGSQAEVGGQWSLPHGGYRRSPGGASPMEKENLAVLDPGQPTGLVHVLVEIGATCDAEAGLLWRVQGQDNLWSLRLSSGGCRLMLKSNGVWSEIAVGDQWSFQPGIIHSVQVLDDGQTFSLYLDGQLLFDKSFDDDRLGLATGVGLQVTTAPNSLYFRAFEAHPRAVPLPAEFDFAKPWNRKGTQVVVADDFDGPSVDLAGRMASSKHGTWLKVMGDGIFELTGHDAVKVRGNVETPNPNRTAYTIDWKEPGFADLQIDITPPGSDRGQLEMGRGGLIFWQDARNYIVVNTWLDDSYQGASISSFFYLDAYEDLFDAVWTNVGGRIRWGVPFTLRIVFDGLNYAAFVDGEPVLYRALTDVYPDCQPLAIHRVGLVANWEWGNDSGSIFERFIARV